MKQQHTIEKLNLQAHYNALAQADQFILSGLISFDKLPTLVHELLAIEIWKENVFPLIWKRLARECSSITTYLVLYHELTLVNLLEVLMFHREACESIGQDGLLELADYCHRKLVYLNTQGPEDRESKERTADELLKMSPEEELEEKVASLRFGTGLCALSILRYLTDYMGDLPLCVMTRLLSTNDVILALVPLVESRPWIRHRLSKGKKVVEKFEDAKWQEQLAEDRLRITKHDAQVWLALNNLLVDHRCRAKYSMDDFRRDSIIKLRKYITEVLLDQLPVLKDLQRVLEEITLMIAPSATDVKASRLILEQVPELRESLLRNRNWAAIAAEQMSSVFSDSAESRTAMQQRMKEMLSTFDFEEMLETPKCAACGAPATQRCSRCKHEWYCGRTCQVATWKKHKPICQIIMESSQMMHEV